MKIVKGKKPKRSHDQLDFGTSFQSKMVRTLYQDPDFAYTTGQYLNPKAFDKRLHQWFANKIVSYSKKHGHGINAEALRHELKRDIKTGYLQKDYYEPGQALIDRMDVPVKERSYIKEELYKFVKHQAFKTAILNSADPNKGHLATGDYEAMDAEFAKVAEIQESLTGGLGTFYVRDVKERTTKRKKYKKDGYSTGTSLDEILKPGGVPKKNLACIVAPSGKGKSHNLVHLGRSAIIASSAKVLHVTLELSQEVILDRYDAAFANIPVQRLEEKPVAVKRAVRELGRQYGEFLVVKEFPPATLTVPGLRSYMRQLERVGFYPDIVIVDYADEMLPTHRARERDAYEEMGQIYSELRKLAVELNVVVWTASQTNKGALTKENFDWNDIADSSQKVMKSDLVICFLQTLAEKKNKTARWWVAKSRLGPDKTDVKLRVDWSKSQIRSVR